MPPSALMLPNGALLSEPRGDDGGETGDSDEEKERRDNRPAALAGDVDPGRGSLLAAPGAGETQGAPSASSVAPPVSASPWTGTVKYTRDCTAGGGQTQTVLLTDKGEFVLAETDQILARGGPWGSPRKIAGRNIPDKLDLCRVLVARTSCSPSHGQHCLPR